MEKHTIVIDAKLEFEMPAKHEVLAVTQSLIWLCDALTKDKNSPLKVADFNLGKRENQS